MSGGTVTLDWPPKELTPNFKRRKHWRVYRPHIAQYRADCAWLTRAWLIREKLVGVKATLKLESVTFYPPDRRKRDDDGMISAFKAGRDGIADVLGVDDHNFRPSYQFAEPVKGGKIIVSIMP